MKLYSLVLDVVPLTVKITKNRPNVFGESFYKLVSYTLYFGSVNCQKSNFKKTDFSEKGSAL